ncbi:hypothetical protein GC173_00130 [bacterium]|nr:hypothetical protein [bacterium]
MRRLTRAVAAVLFAGISVAHVAALTVTPLDDKLVSVEVATSGTTREDALNEARTRAVLSTAGRVLLDNQLLRADELMDKYLRTYSANFVTAIEVYEERFTGGQNVLSSRVFVDYEKLVNDLHEKRFLYAPAYKPMFTVFMAEDIDGASLSQEVARPLLRNALETQGMRPYKGTITTPPTDVDVKADSDLTKSALEAAERRNVELLVTGTTTTRQRGEKDYYYDKFYFYDCEMTASLIRVDTGEELKTVTVRGSASDRDRAEAIRLSIERASALAAVDIEERYATFWPRVVQSGSDFEVLLTGADDELIRIISQHLNGVGIDAEISLKKKFDTSAVLTVRTKARRDSLIEVLRACPYPALTIIREVGDKKFEVQVAS